MESISDVSRNVIVQQVKASSPARQGARWLLGEDRASRKLALVIEDAVLGAFCSAHRQVVDPVLLIFELVNTIFGGLFKGLVSGASGCFGRTESVCHGIHLNFCQTSYLGQMPLYVTAVKCVSVRDQPRNLNSSALVTCKLKTG